MFEDIKVAAYADNAKYDTFQKLIHCIRFLSAPRRYAFSRSAFCFVFLAMVELSH